MLLLQFSRILQTEMMIETLAHRDMGSRLVSFLLILCRDFGVPNADGITIDPFIRRLQKQLPASPLPGF